MGKTERKGGYKNVITELEDCNPSGFNWDF